MKYFGLNVGLKKSDAFEGWFSKVDDSKNGVMFSVIWGYSTHHKTKHAFIQFQDTMRHDTAYVRYPIEEMQVETDPFILHIGKNRLWETGMHLDFDLEGVPVRGDFSFSNLMPIKQSVFKPNIMGWLSYFPNQCNHAIISMHHQVTGDFQMGDQSWAIRDAYGYMEKDWGTGFPKEYVWLQANIGDKDSVVFSYATVPMLGKYAKGFFLVLHHKGKEYRFSSIEGSKLLQFEVSKEAFKATVKKRGRYIILKVKQRKPVDLVSPEHGEMNAYIKESLEGSLELIMKNKKEPAMRLTSQSASIDIHFDEDATDQGENA